MATRIENAVRRLEAFPMSGRVVPEYEEESLRELIVGGYRVVYIVERDDVDVLAIVHGKRAFPRPADP